MREELAGLEQNIDFLKMQLRDGRFEARTTLASGVVFSPSGDKSARDRDHIRGGNREETMDGGMDNFSDSGVRVGNKKVIVLKRRKKQTPSESTGVEPVNKDGSGPGANSRQGSYMVELDARWRGGIEGGDQDQAQSGRVYSTANIKCTGGTQRVRTIIKRVVVKTSSTKSTVGTRVVTSRKMLVRKKVGAS